MHKYILTIILPSINPALWLKLTNQITKSVGKYSFQIIASGPFFPSKELENLSNFLYIRDLGSPSRALMAAASISSGKYLTWLPDDCIIEELALEKCVNFLENKSNKDGLTIRYSEGINYTGSQDSDDSYWLARTHADLRLPFVKDSWRIAPIFMYNLDYFKEMGGVNCSFEHLNLNTHELSFKIQEDNGTIFPSPVKVFSSNWQPWSNIESQKSPIQLAYEQNDKPLFDKRFSTESFLKEKISFDNWRYADPIWKRRFKEV